jgi:hypothetical protein
MHLKPDQPGADPFRHEQWLLPFSLRICSHACGAESLMTSARLSPQEKSLVTRLL